MSCIPYIIYTHARTREACEPSSRRNTLQMSHLAIIFYFFFLHFTSVRRGVRSARPAPYPVLPSRRCTTRPEPMRPEPMRPTLSRRAVEPSSRCATRRAFRRAPCDARNVGAWRVHRCPERRESLETALHNRRNALTINKLRTQPPKLDKNCINTHKSPAYMQ